METDDVQELVTANENRRTIYSFLTRVYAKEVDVEFLKELVKKKELFLSSAQNPNVQGTELAEGFRQMAEYAKSLEGRDLEKARLELAVDYAGVFLGVWKVVPHPSESAYKTDGQLIMQKFRDEVLEKYRMMGLQKAEDFHEPEDHVALELQFMAYLSDKTSNALKEGEYAEAKRYLDAQSDFLNEHLGQWVPKMTSDIVKGARQELYKATAKITKAYVEMDKQVLAELIGNLNSHSQPDPKE